MPLTSNLRGAVRHARSARCSDGVRCIGWLVHVCPSRSQREIVPTLPPQPATRRPAPVEVAGCHGRCCARAPRQHRELLAASEMVTVAGLLGKRAPPAMPAQLSIGEPAGATGSILRAGLRRGCDLLLPDCALWHAGGLAARMCVKRDCRLPAAQRQALPCL